MKDTRDTEAQAFLERFAETVSDVIFNADAQGMCDCKPCTDARKLLAEYAETWGPRGYAIPQRYRVNFLA